MSDIPKNSAAGRGAHERLRQRRPTGARAPYLPVSTGKTSGEADFGRSFRVVAGPRLCVSPRVLRHNVSLRTWINTHATKAESQQTLGEAACVSYVPKAWGDFKNGSPAAGV